MNSTERTLSCHPQLSWIPNLGSESLGSGVKHQAATVMHQLMLHHHQMFFKLNKSGKNGYFSMKQICPMSLDLAGLAHHTMLHL